jgi:hypothetical protein
MTTLFAPLRNFFPIPVAILLTFALAVCPGRAETVKVSPGENLQTVVNANPEGTTFLLQPGVYRMQTVAPRNSDIFTGEPGAILNGSQVLTFGAEYASGFWGTRATVLPVDDGQCQPAKPLCNNDQDLFVDGVLQTPAAQLVGLKAGEWYFDRKAGMVYIPTSPAGHLVELGMAQFAFAGIASNVWIENLTVEEYANPAQTGAVGGYKEGSNWIVSHVESRFNHGTGISLGQGGMMGAAIVGSTNSVVSYTELGWNNYAGYGDSWEAGGAKFWDTVNLTVVGNYVHDNDGSGLWSDYNNIGTLYEKNLIVNNTGAGINHEISYRATIVGNTVENNGISTTGYLDSAQIELLNSSNVEIASNTVEVAAAGGAGIAVINEERGIGTYGPWISAYNSIHNNLVIYYGEIGHTGLANYAPSVSTAGTLFDYNQYIVKAGGTEHWTWDTNMDWSQLHDVGQELHGRCCD